MKFLTFFCASILIAGVLCDVKIAEFPEDVAAFKTEHNDGVMAILFENDHPNAGFWSSVLNQFNNDNEES